MNVCISGSGCFCGKYYSFKQVCVHGFSSDVILDNKIVRRPGCIHHEEHDKREIIPSIHMLQIITEMVRLVPIFGHHNLHQAYPH